jgi:hypothetical protein
MGPKDPLSEERAFAEFRRKVRDSELLSASVLRLLELSHFTGRVSVVVQNGRILKSGYEEGYFSRRTEERLT